VCHDSSVPGVLVVLFWIWLAVALGVYAYRIFRRATQGPKSVRQARAAEGGGSPSSGAGSLSRFGKGAVAPLPDGPLEARLPQSLRDLPPPVDAEGNVVIPSGGPSRSTLPGPGHHDGADPDAAPADAPAPRPAPPTLADALQGIQMPAGLLPVVDAADAVGLDLVDDRRARFGATGTNVPTVAVALGDELRRLGYTVDGLETITSGRAGLTATRGTVAVTATVTIDDDTGAVVVQLST